MFKDSEPLLAQNFQQHLNRKFKSSLLTPFASNVAFVLNDCNNEDYKISVLVNELPVGKLNAGKLACVSSDEMNESICNYHDLKLLLSDSLESNFEELCKNEKSFEATEEVHVEL